MVTSPGPWPAGRRVTVVPDGPVLVEGPLECVLDDGAVVSSDRFLVAVCVCRRSRRYPLCDTSHRRRVRTRATGDTGSDTDAGPAHEVAQADSGAPVEPT